MQHEVYGTTRTESEFKTSLSDFVKIPASEFDRQFREWMERDDVARSLQANLRKDLIQNFNKTALGKQIVSQLSMATGGATQRLTLSPLVLALNTLVGEFLYAQNCHFTLSVFCTEVPFRNTLPDFETSQIFRFNEVEMTDIIDAVAGNQELSRQLNSRIASKYADNTSISLLLLLLKALLDLLAVAPARSAQPSEPPAPPIVESVQKPQHGMNTTEPAPVVSGPPRKVSRQASDSNFRHLNNYLIALSKKVQAMTKEFEGFQQMQQRPIQVVTADPLPTRSLDSSRYDHLNRSLERIAENLKHVSSAKHRDKHVGAIVSAIEAMAEQFTRCATKFDSVSLGLQCDRTTPRLGTVDKETETVQPRPERSYTDWLRRLRRSKHGQHFMKRIEVCMRKALNRQKDHLSSEMEMKLRHQKELLRIRYKQKLLDHLSKHGAGDYASHKRQITENIEDQLKKFEAKHMELLEKIREAETAARQASHAAQTKEPQQIREVPGRPQSAAATMSPHSTKDDVSETQQKLPQQQPVQEPNIDHIVYDAKLRIQELENESNLLDVSFRDYLARHRLQKEASHEMTKQLWDRFAVERETLRDRHMPPTSDDFVEHMMAQQEAEHFAGERRQRGATAGSEPHAAAIEPNGRNATVNAKCSNAIVEAKERFFKDEWRGRVPTHDGQQLPTRQLDDLPSRGLQKDDEVADLRQRRDDSTRHADALLRNRIQLNQDALSNSNSTAINSVADSCSPSSTSTANEAEGNSVTSGHSSASSLDVAGASVRERRCKRQLFGPVVAAHHRRSASMPQQGGGGGGDAGASKAEVNNNNKRADDHGEKSGNKANIEQISENKATETLAANARAAAAVKDNEQPARGVGKKSAPAAVGADGAARDGAAPAEGMTTAQIATTAARSSPTTSLTVQQSMAKIEQLFAGRASDDRRRPGKRHPAARRQAAGAVVDASGKTFVGRSDDGKHDAPPATACDDDAHADDDDGDGDVDGDGDDDSAGAGPGVVDGDVDVRNKNRQQLPLRKLRQIETHAAAVARTAKTPTAAASPPATSMARSEFDTAAHQRMQFMAAVTSIASTSGSDETALEEGEYVGGVRQVASSTALDKYDESEVEAMMAEVNGVDEDDDDDDDDVDEDDEDDEDDGDDEDEVDGDNAGLLAATERRARDAIIAYGGDDTSDDSDVELLLSTGGGRAAPGQLSDSGSDFWG